MYKAYVLSESRIERMTQFVQVEQADYCEVQAHNFTKTYVINKAY